MDVECLEVDFKLHSREYLSRFERYGETQKQNKKKQKVETEHKEVKDIKKLDEDNKSQDILDTFLDAHTELFNELKAVFCGGCC